MADSDCSIYLIMLNGFNLSQTAPTWDIKLAHRISMGRVGSARARKGLAGEGQRHARVRSS